MLNKAINLKDLIVRVFKDTKHKKYQDTSNILLSEIEWRYIITIRNILSIFIKATIKLQGIYNY